MKFGGGSLYVFLYVYFLTVIKFNTSYAAAQDNNEEVIDSKAYEPYQKAFKEYNKDIEYMDSEIRKLILESLEAWEEIETCFRKDFTLPYNIYTPKRILLNCLKHHELIFNPLIVKDFALTGTYTKAALDCHIRWLNYAVSHVNQFRPMNFPLESGFDFVFFQHRAEGIYYNQLILILKHPENKFDNYIKENALALFKLQAVTFVFSMKSEIPIEGAQDYYSEVYDEYSVCLKSFIRDLKSYSSQLRLLVRENDNSFKIPGEDSHYVKTMNALLEDYETNCSESVINQIKLPDPQKTLFFLCQHIEAMNLAIDQVKDIKARVFSIQKWDGRVLFMFKCLSEELFKCQKSIGRIHENSMNPLVPLKP